LIKQLLGCKNQKACFIKPQANTFVKLLPIILNKIIVKLLKAGIKL
jgi:hypothetical protein